MEVFGTASSTMVICSFGNPRLPAGPCNQVWPPQGSRCCVLNTPPSAISLPSDNARHVRVHSGLCGLSLLQAVIRHWSGCDVHLPRLWGGEGSGHDARVFNNRKKLHFCGKWSCSFPKNFSTEVAVVCVCVCVCVCVMANTIRHTEKNDDNPWFT